MAGRETFRRGSQIITPILSVDKEEARRRVIKLYKAWYRQIPFISKCSTLTIHVHCKYQWFQWELLSPVQDYHIPRTTEQCRHKLREEFTRHRDITDIRTIDMLALLGQSTLKETVFLEKSTVDVMRYMDTGDEMKQNKFLSKFLVGKK